MRPGKLTIIGITVVLSLAADSGSFAGAKSARTSAKRSGISTMTPPRIALKIIPRIQISCDVLECRARVKTRLTQIEALANLQRDYQSWNDCDWFDSSACDSLMQTIGATARAALDDAVGDLCACGSQQDRDRLALSAGDFGHQIPACPSQAGESHRAGETSCKAEICSDALDRWLHQLESYSEMWGSFTRWRLCTAQPGICHTFVSMLKEEAIPALSAAAERNCECGTEASSERLSHFADSFDFNLPQCPSELPSSDGSRLVY